MKKLSDWHFFLRIPFSLVIAISAICTLDAQIVQYTTDANTILLDHFTGTTSATISAFKMDGSPNGTAYPSATPSYSYGQGPNGLNQALTLNPPSGMPAGSGTYLNYPGGQLLSHTEGTIEFWVYLPPFSTGLTLVDQGLYFNAAAGWTFGMGVDATGQLNASAWAAFSMNSGTTKVPSNTWTHVAATWGSSGAKLYINGVLVGSDTNTGMPASGYGGSVLVIIGTHAISGAGIDELRISNKARLPSEFNLSPTSTLTTITSFTPTTGPIGTSVTITGTNFSSTAANNIVWFGAVQATVTSATATQLIVKVPLGATYQPISVTVAGNTAYSKAPFTVTFASTQVIDATSFATKVDITTGTGAAPNGVIICDIDGDSKPDLSIANSGSNTVSVFRNISTSGSITSGSFATKVDFTLTKPTGTLMGDIDGDGKPDLVVTNYNSSTISVFRNTSTSGSITFATKVDFATGVNPYLVAIGDIDGDGKPDLAVTNLSSSTVSVFRNTSTSGSITFASKIDLNTGTNPHGVTIGDIDGDGMPDLIVANNGGNNVSIFRNTSTSGSILASSFASKVDFSTGTNPHGVAIGDIDGDGKPDLVVTNSGSTNVSVFRNTSSSGSITFATKVDFPSGTTPYGVAIGDIDGDGKPDLTVTNNGGSTVSIFRNTSSSGSITFATKVDFAAGVAPFDVAIGDVDGDGLPDLVVTNSSSSNISVLRNTISLTAPTAPTIGTITHPTCDLSTGSVVLNGLPSLGTWTLTRTPGGTTTTGTGISTTISALAAGTYTYTVTSSVSGLTSAASANVVINAQPATPTAPTVGTITQPTCLVAGSVILSGLPATGTWTLTKSPGGTTTTGTGTSSTVSGLTTGTYTYTVANASGCTSAASANVVINALPTQAAPTVGTITQPSCPVPTGSAVLSGLPSSGTWTLTRTPGGTTTTGTGTSSTISGLAAGTYTYTVTSASGCTSVASANVVINTVKVGVIPKIKSKWNDILICYNLGDSIRSYKWYKGSTLISGTDTTKQLWATGKQIGVYLVSTTDKNGCKNSSNSISISGTKSFSVYPNPAKENFAVTMNDETLGKTVITIINEMGTKVMEVETEKEFDDLYKVIPVTNLDEGVYYVKVSVNRVNVYYTKIVVLK